MRGIFVLALSFSAVICPVSKSPRNDSAGAGDGIRTHEWKLGRLLPIETWLLATNAQITSSSIVSPVKDRIKAVYHENRHKETILRCVRPILEHVCVKINYLLAGATTLFITSCPVYQPSSNQPRRGFAGQENRHK